MKRRAVLFATVLTAEAACSLSLDGYSGGTDGLDGAQPPLDASIDGQPPDAPDGEGAPPLGTPAVLAPNQPGARGLTLFGDYVYWARSDGVLLRAQKHGGAVETIGKATALVNVAVDATYAYATDTGGSRIMRFNLPTDPAPYELSTGHTSPWGIAIDATYAYFTTAGNLRRVPKDGTGVVVNLQSATIGTNLLIANGRIFWMNEQGVPAVESALIPGGTDLHCYMDNQTNPHGVAVDQTTVFHVTHMDAPNGKIRKKALADTCTSAQATEMALGIDSPFEIIVVGNDLIWTVDKPNGSIMTMPKDASSAPRALAIGQDTPWGIVADTDGTLYWTNSGASGAVMSLPH
jgi:hypothetical protein